MSEDDTYRKGGYWIIDDRSGERIRATDARREWDGDVVHKDDYEERHPQELMRGRRDNQKPNGPIRPEEIPVFGGPLITTLATAAAAGATSLTLTSAARLEAGDFIRVFLDNAESFRVLVQTVVGDVVGILNRLPSAASAGNSVVDESAVASDNIG